MVIACEEPNLAEALAAVAVMDCERAIRQAFRNARDGRSDPNGALWDTCFLALFKQVLRVYETVRRTPKKDDRVRINARSEHHGKTGTVWYTKDVSDQGGGLLVTVSIADPRSIGGHTSATFPAESLEVLPSREEAEAALGPAEERRTLARVAAENVRLYENLATTQDRCGSLLLAARAMRQKILELGGEDPGAP